MKPAESETPTPASEPPQSEIESQYSESSSTKGAPPLPPRDEKPNFKPIYTTKSPTVQILTFRQSELCGSQATATPLDAVSGRKTDVGSRVDAAVSELEDSASDFFWPNVAQNYSDAFVREGNLEGIEDRLLKGIPDPFRGMAYLKVLGVHSVLDEQKYDAFLKSAKLATFESKDPALDYTAEQKELLNVLRFTFREASTGSLGDNLVNNHQFAERVVSIVSSLDGWNKQEQLSVLAKLTRLHSIVDKDEFAYKTSRALEDKYNKEFLHVTTQGIDLLKFLRDASLEIFTAGESSTLLDFVLFEGFDFIIQVICALVEEQSTSILAVNGDELQQFLIKNLFEKLDSNTFTLATKLEISLIKYENEFQLMTANSISGNTNELSNLKETNHDLKAKKEELTEKLVSLKKTHQEIYDQKNDADKLLKQANEEKAALLDKRAQLEGRYAQLTMKENLSNTIKANEDISRGNAEFEEQIAELKKKIETKRAKLKI